MTNSHTRTATTSRERPFRALEPLMLHRPPHGRSGITVISAVDSLYMFQRSLWRTLQHQTVHVETLSQAPR